MYKNKNIKEVGSNNRMQYTNSFKN